MNSSSLGAGTDRPPDDSATMCEGWQDAEHFLFRTANLCFATAFLVPSAFRRHALATRALLALGCLHVLLWSVVVACEVDVFTWYLIFLVVNVTRLVIAAFAVLPPRIQPELEEVYLRLMQPLRVSRGDFKRLLNTATLHHIPGGTCYAREGVTPAGEKHSILLTGRFKVTYKDMCLHYVEPNEFLDSPEYMDNSRRMSDGKYQVTITAMEDSCLLTWLTGDLQRYLDSRHPMKAIINGLVARDIMHKLYHVQPAPNIKSVVVSAASAEKFF
ncbi:hypothetical protein LSAT2_002642 [Lamellibrachia satsuma]|nr:hypothetical protein LSAT2_002642 [Lamellibrachia satsuma]